MLVCALVMLTILQLTYSGQVDLGQTQKYGVGYLAVTPTSKLGNSWTLRPWLGSDVAFSRARQDLEGRFTKAEGRTEAKLKELQKLAEVAPRDPLAQYRWGYLASLMAARDAENGIDRWFGRQGIDSRGRIRWALALASDPRCAEYDRLRFLYEAPLSPADQFRELGKRLALKWPKDEAIRRNQALSLAVSKREEDVDSAISIADDLWKKNPNRLRYVGLKAAIYQFAWMSLHRREDGLLCIDWIKRYLRVAPTTATSRDGFEHTLKYLQEKL